MTPAARLWGGAFALSLLAHAALAWALSTVSAGTSASTTQTRFEIRPSVRGEAARVAARTLEATADAEPAATAPKPAVVSRAETAARDVSAARPAPAPRVAADKMEAPPAAAAAIDPVEPSDSAEVAQSAEISTRAGESVPAARAATEQTAAIPQAMKKAVSPGARAAPLAEDAIPKASLEASTARAAASADSARIAVAAGDETRLAEGSSSAAVRSPSRRTEPARTTTGAAARTHAMRIESSPSAPEAIVPPRSAGQNALAGRPAVSQAAGRPSSPAVSAAADTAEAVGHAAATEHPRAAASPSGGVPAAAVAAGRPAVASTPDGGATAVALLVPDEPEPFESVRSRLSGALRTENSGGCFVALAAKAGQPLAVRGFAADPARLGRFERRFADIFGDAVGVHAYAIATPQCATIAFVHQRVAEPETRIGISIDQPVIASGTEMSGSIVGVERPWLYLMVVDDEGIVHELPNLTQDGGGTIRFRAPLTLTDGRVGTAQLLIALAADEALDTPVAGAGDAADAFFTALEAELRDRTITVDFGMAGFRVE